MFAVEARDRVRERVLEMAANDDRVVAGAIVGSLALSTGDRWSDLDLTFAVNDAAPVGDVLADWTAKIVQEFDAAHLFDLAAGASIYRVFLLPGCLQFDLSFTPAAQFGATSPRFKLLFGKAVEKQHIQPTPAHELFGYAVHHVVRARICIERGRYWQAEYWISSARDYALSLACRLRNLSPFYGRSYDDLPEAVRERFLGALPVSLQRDHLLAALRVVIDGLLEEAAELPDTGAKIEPRLRELTQA
ncbi:MAG: nucleotidyltransferase domain-containing protein [Chthoniobacterales bacterium]